MIAQRCMCLPYVPDAKVLFVGYNYTGSHFRSPLKVIASRNVPALVSRLADHDSSRKNHTPVLPCLGRGRKTADLTGLRSSKQYRSRQAGRVRSSYVPFHYNEEEYVEVCPCNAPYGPVNSLTNGGTCTILFKQSDAEMSLDMSVLEVFIGGDTARNVSLLANNQIPDRPLLHDLLWQVLERGQEISKREWKIVRVAIVTISQDAFIGRLFFGDTETNKVVWDCDCRPSDGFWLSLKSGAPMLVSKHVFEAAGKRLRDTTTYEKQLMRQYKSRQAAQFEGMRSAAAMPMEQTMPIASSQMPPSDPQDLHAIKTNDLEAIKLLKRELQVAVKEEDYARCAAIRDHPYMKIYKEIEECKKLGKYDEAYDMQAHLQKMIETAENQSGILDK